MKIAVVGTGYVGLVSGTCFAESGNEVVCVDIDEAKVRAMQAGKPPIYELGLEELLQHNLQAGRISFTTKLAEAIPGAQVILLALPTPPGADGAADLSAVLKVAEQLGPLLNDYAVVVTKSTVPAGTTEQVHERIAKHTTNFDAVSNPEFLREGRAVEDFHNPDRVVVGTMGEALRARQLMAELYRPFVDDDRPLFFMDVRSAEVTKYAANAFLAMKISFINEIASLCEKVGADAEELRQALGTDQRIGHAGLFPGLGYGGSCLPKDVRALLKIARDHDFQFQLLEATLAANDRQKGVLVSKIKHYFDHDLKGKTFALWGLAFKAGTDDIRESASLVISDQLLAAGAKIVAYDPEAGANAAKYYTDQPNFSLADEPFKALADADALVIATEWSIFQSADPGKIASQLKKPIVFDGRNLYDPQTMQAAGIHYESIGRAPA